MSLSASLARTCVSENMNVVLVARNINKLKDLKNEKNVYTIQCDSSNIQNVNSLFEQLDKIIGTPNLVIYNPSA